MNTYEKAFSKINLRKSDAGSNRNTEIVPVMIKWQDAARQLFYRITLNPDTEVAGYIFDFVSDDEMFKMFEDNKTVGDVVNYALSIKNGAK